MNEVRSDDDVLYEGIMGEHAHANNMDGLYSSIRRGVCFVVIVPSKW